MDMVDTTKEVGKGILNIYKNYNHIHIGGYTQLQYQAASAQGIKSYNGGDFSAYSSDRFIIRRGRIRFDYIRYTKQNQPFLQFAYQLDATERGVFVRDLFGRLFENKWQLFAFTGGIFARPFGYELNLSSAERESPERGRMSQILMKTERDLGAMATFEPRKTTSSLKNFKLDAGFFNGQGLNALTDYDSYKDLIARAALKPVHINNAIQLSAGLSFFEGGLRQNTKYLYTTQTSSSSVKQNMLDSNQNNAGRKLIREYRGADMQLRFKENTGYTELRGEYWYGKQPGSVFTSETPATLLNEPYYLRNFNGAFFWLLQNIFNKKNQLVVKLDWYDPNSKVAGNEIDSAGKFSAADIKFTTLGFGYNYYLDENIKFMLWYDKVWNEKTKLSGFISDIKDNVFTFRLQFRF